MTPPTGTGGKDNADHEKGRYCEKRPTGKGGSGLHLRNSLAEQGVGTCVVAWVSVATA